MKLLIATAVALVAGVAIGAWFTLDDRRELSSTIEKTRTQLDIATGESRIKSEAIDEINIRLDGLSDRLAELDWAITCIQDGVRQTDEALTAALSFNGLDAQPQPIIQQPPLPTETASAQPQTAAAKTEPSDDRCTATTLRGTRCSRRSKANGRCWQHQFENDEP